MARQRLKLYRELLPDDQRKEVDQMMAEVGQLDARLRQEATQPAGGAERARQGHSATGWWERVNGWFKKHL